MVGLFCNFRILLAFGLLLSPRLSAQAVEPLSTTVGKVQNEVVTSRDVYISGWIESVLYPSASGQGSPLPQVKSGEFRRLTKALLLEAVVALEARSFSAVSLTPAELTKAETVLRKSLKSNSKMKTLEVEFAEIKASLRRKLMSKKFIRFKAESSVVSVTDAEAKAYFEENRLKFGDLPFENFKENIKVFLTREQVDKRLRDWFEVLQSKYRVESYEDAQSI